MLLALGIAPIFLLWETGVLPGLVYEAIARQIANAPGYIALIGIPVLAHYAFSSPTELDQIKREISEDWVFWGVLIVSLTPALWFQVLESGSDTFVALLTLLGIYAVMNDRWLVAGLLVGSATFKFTALPLAAVLALYSIRIGWKQFGAVAIGGVVSQIPNVLYYAIFPRDLLFVIEQRGKMSLYSGETRSVATAPFRAAGLEQWYIEVGFLFALVIFVGLGLAVTLRRKNLVLGFAVAYLATSYFAPVGEINASVLTVFLLFEGAANFQRRPARYLVAWLLAVELYSFLLPLRFIDYVSVVPFPWWDSAIQMVEFGTVIIVLVGLAYLSDHGRFRAP